MTPPWWNQTVTHYARQTDSTTGRVQWKRAVYSNCFWGQKSIRERTDGAAFAQHIAIVRIPSPAPDVHVNDILVRGSVRDTVDEYAAGSRSADLIKKYAGGCLVVNAAHENTDPTLPMPHLYIEGA